MFCHKCGSKIADDVSFCPECGAKVMSADSVLQRSNTPAVSDRPGAPGPAQPLRRDVPSHAPKKKKSRKLPIILGAVSLVIVAVIVIAMNWNGSVDYEATVRAHKPFAVSQGLPYSYGQILDKYILSPRWSVRESGDVNYVDIRGTAKGTDKKIVVTIAVSPDSTDSDIVSIVPESVTVDGERTSTEDEAVRFMLAMFVAYDEKYNDLSNFSQILSEINADLQGEVSLTETYTNDTAGISFKYPDGWVVLDSVNEFQIVNMIDSKNNADHIASFEVCCVLDKNPYGIFTGDESSIREAVNEYYTFLKFEDILIGDIPVKGMAYQTAGLKGDDIVVNFWYNMGDDVYQIKCSYSASAAGTYEPVFEAIMDSYTITAAYTPVESAAVYASGFPLVTSTDAMSIFDEWATSHPLIGNYHLDLITDDDTDENGNKIFLFTLETSDAGVFNMSIRKADGYMQYISKFDTMSMDDWYNDWFADIPDNGGETIYSDLFYKGVSLTNLLGRKPEELTGVLGAPTSGTPVDGLRYEGSEYYGYQGIAFVIDYQTGTIGRIVGEPNFIEVNGATLDKNRAGILNVLGIPTSEDSYYNESGYVMEYTIYDGGIITAITIKMPDANSNANQVLISQYFDS